jgi:hypothetical protein
MDIKLTNKQGFKNFLKLYNRYIYSIVNQNNCEELPDEIITDEELDFLYNLYQEIEFNKQISITK